MPNIPGSLDEFEKAFEAGAQGTVNTIKKNVGQVASDTTKQVRPTEQDIVNALYAPSEKSVGQNTPNEAGIEQVPQGGGQQQQQAPQKAESIKSNAEKYGTLADQIPFLPGQRESEYKKSTGSLEDEIPVLPGFGDPGKTVSLEDQLTGQLGSKEDIMKRAGVDPTKQMTEAERGKLDGEQKRQREQMSQHNREYVKFGTPLDPIGSLEEQVAKVRQEKQKEEQQQREEEEQKKKEEEEKKKQEQQQLVEPTTKPKPGDPNVAIGQAQKKTEVHRGAAG